MFRQWLTLVIIVLVYIPVAIDATVLHVAAPTLSMTLGASGNELLWIIDIYSLVIVAVHKKRERDPKKMRHHVVSHLT